MSATAKPHRITKRRNLGRWIEARRVRLAAKLDPRATNPGGVLDMSAESVARCRARLAQRATLTA